MEAPKLLAEFHVLTFNRGRVLFISSNFGDHLLFVARVGLDVDVVLLLAG